MSVRFMYSGIVHPPWDPPGTTATITTLFGEPFPPDDVRAYWGLVPMNIAVEWSPTLSIFFVTNLDRWYPREDDEAQPVVRRQIMATDAHKLSVWMETIAALVNDTP